MLCAPSGFCTQYRYFPSGTCLPFSTGHRQLLRLCCWRFLALSVCLNTVLCLDLLPCPLSSGDMSSRHHHAPRQTVFDAPAGKVATSSSGSVLSGQRKPTSTPNVRDRSACSSVSTLVPTLPLCSSLPSPKWMLGAASTATLPQTVGAITDLIEVLPPVFAWHLSDFAAAPLAAWCGKHC